MAWTDHLPSWASVEWRDTLSGGSEMWVEVEADIVYPKILGKLAILDPNLDCEPTQEMLTLARYIFTRYLKKIMYDNGGEPPMRLHIVDKNRTWALKKFEFTGRPLDKRGIYKELGIYNIKTNTHVSLD